MMENGWVDSKKNLRDCIFSMREIEIAGVDKARYRRNHWRQPDLLYRGKGSTFFFFHLSAWWANLGTTMLEGNGNGAQIQICLTPVHRSITSEIWYYPLLERRPARGKRRTCPGDHFHIRKWGNRQILRCGSQLRVKTRLKEVRCGCLFSCNALSYTLDVSTGESLSCLRFSTIFFSYSVWCSIYCLMCTLHFHQ